MLLDKLALHINIHILPSSMCLFDFQNYSIKNSVLNASLECKVPINSFPKIYFRYKLCAGDKALRFILQLENFFYHFKYQYVITL